MKTAEQWFSELESTKGWLTMKRIGEDQIKAIQLEAFKAGLSKAAEMLMCEKRWAGGCDDCDGCNSERAILTHRDNLTTLP